MAFERFYLADAKHYFIYRPDKYSGNKLAELFENNNPASLKLITVDNWKDQKISHDQVINIFEAFLDSNKER